MALAGTESAPLGNIAQLALESNPIVHHLTKPPATTYCALNQTFATALTLVETHCLTRPKLEAVLANHPAEAQFIRKAAIQLALRRGVKRVAQDIKLRNKVHRTRFPMLLP